jgi:2-polyprenyl-6-methoxyphenol hydroxylase-like FAD-dependent oxidoreductase
MMTVKTAVVVGGGIGGLTAAAVLTARGWRVEVLDAGSGETGSGISLWPNALRALDTVDLGEAIRGLGRLETEGGIRDQNGRWLIQPGLAEVERHYGPLVVLHRADLMTTLNAALPAGTVRMGVRVHGIGIGRAAVSVEHSAGQSVADLVIGADGVHSTIRRLLWPTAGPPRHAGYTAWRMIISPARPLAGGGESWGAGERFGIVPLRDGRIYCYATANTPAGQHADGSELDELRRRFGGWHDPIPELLDQARHDAVLRNDILEAPVLGCYASSGRVVLLGDAAHAMTPDLGQGACQAMEDAVVLGEVLDGASTRDGATLDGATLDGATLDGATLDGATLDEPTGVAAALARYDELRRPRTQSIARRSRRIGLVAQWSSGPAVAARRLMLRMTPGRTFVNGLRPVLDWSPGQ